MASPRLYEIVELGSRWAIVSWLPVKHEWVKMPRIAYFSNPEGILVGVILVT